MQHTQKRNKNKTSWHLIKLNFVKIVRYPSYLKRKFLSVPLIEKQNLQIKVKADLISFNKLLIKQM